MCVVNIRNNERKVKIHDYGFADIVNLYITYMKE